MQCIKHLFFSLAFGLISGCASSLHTYKINEEFEAPKPTMTQLSEHMACFGDMLSDYRRVNHDGKLTPLLFAVTSVKDATDVSTVDFANSEIPSDFNDMTTGIISRIGGPIRVLHVPTSLEIVNGLRLAGTGGASPFSLQRYTTGALQIFGALTEYDRLIKNRQRELDLAAELGDGSGLTNLEASFEKEKNTARMTMDFRIVQSVVGDVINHISSTNTIRLYQRGKDMSFGASIDGQGIGFATSESLVDARHKAIRLLIELGIIQIIGRYAKIPYWKCLVPEQDNSVVKTKDLLEQNNGQYNFVSEDDGSQNSSDSNDCLADKENHKPVDCIDNRDKDLIMRVASDYEYAEYINQSTRWFIVRPDQEFSLAGDPDKKQLNGKKQKIHNLLKLYQRQSTSGLSDVDLLNKIRGSFIDQGILTPQDDAYSTASYLALWANAPVQKGARWKLR